MHTFRTHSFLFSLLFSTLFFFLICSLVLRICERKIYENRKKICSCKLLHFQRGFITKVVARGEKTVNICRNNEFSSLWITSLPAAELTFIWQPLRRWHLEKPIKHQQMHFFSDSCTASIFQTRIKRDGLLLIVEF